ncbi:hypothetical protein M8C21_002871 [Ambrosia artemisiifolia]|uniref:Uncharacterized protein n=2 Tax=Ambrosia artemisiifolia TaxID=4212 RepID=A0AAD5D3C7_AMBAR|nr:hypothetical protein M8C21_002871 [Ambrosia artemisiifolia]
MAPGGNVYEDVTESCADYGVKSSHRSCGSAGGRVGTVSNSGVHDLLKCPMRVTVMCPPIHQRQVSNPKSLLAANRR